MTTGIRVLLVDDEQEFREVLSERLAQRGVEVSDAASGEQALAKLAARPVDVVVLDVRMPGLGGVATLRRIKQEHPGVEVIMLSGVADVDVAVAGLDLGAFDYMVKPVDIEELVHRLEDAQRSRVLAGTTR